jgi:protein-tyrosine phosphatase/arsenate reductase
MFPQIQSHCDRLVQEFQSISEDRKILLEKISNYIQVKKDYKQAIHLMYVCTHNSRRSHFGQIWARVAAHYFQITDVHTYSGGTEATAFHPNAIKALESTGFSVIPDTIDANATFTVRFSLEETTTCFSKVYDDDFNPHSNFAAIMTCSDAEENCPFIPGVELRVGTTYDDPKAFDGSVQQDQKYLERSEQIALECLYVFSRIH